MFVKIAQTTAIRVKPLLENALNVCHRSLTISWKINVAALRISIKPMPIFVKAALPIVLNVKTSQEHARVANQHSLLMNRNRVCAAVSRLLRHISMVSVSHLSAAAQWAITTQVTIRV